MVLVFSAAIIILCGLLFSLYAYKTCFYNKPTGQDDLYGPLHGAAYLQLADSIYASSRAMEKVPFEPVWITAHDGTRLYGRYYHLRKDAPVEILMHGYRGRALRDCSGGHYLARKMGFNSLVIDQRSHGKSGGTTITFGIKERLDCLCWIKYINDRLDSKPPILLSGLSMGAATVLAASSLELPDNVVGIIADSPFTAPKEIICKVCGETKLNPRLAWPFISLGARIFGGFSPTQSSAIHAVTHARVPILLIHGEADDFVPCQMSHDIAAACASPCRLHTFQNADHGLAYMVNPRGYERAVYSFLTSIPALDGMIDGEPVEEK